MGVTVSKSKVYQLPSSVEVLGAISDIRSLHMFKVLESGALDSQTIIKRLKLTRKEYYSRMSRLTKVNLVYRRENGTYSFTSLGKEFNTAVKLMEDATNISWKLDALDAVERLGNTSKEHMLNLIDSLIDDTKIREILRKNYM